MINDFFKKYSLDRSVSNKRNMYCLLVFIILMINRSNSIYQGISNFSNNIVGRLLFLSLIIYTCFQDPCLGLMITLIFIILLDFSPSTKEGFSFGKESMPKDFGISSSSFSGKSLKIGGGSDGDGDDDKKGGMFGGFAMGKKGNGEDGGGMFNGVGIGKIGGGDGDKKGGMFGGFGGGNKDGDDKKGGMFGGFGGFGGGNKDGDDKKGGMFGGFGGLVEGIKMVMIKRAACLVGLVEVK